MGLSDLDTRFMVRFVRIDRSLHTSKTLTTKLRFLDYQVLKLNFRIGKEELQFSLKYEP